MLLRIEDASQIADARRHATEIARSSGFREETIGAAALIVSEAASNLLKHARQGEMQLRADGVDGARELEVLAMDKGPGMSDADACLKDGFSSAGTAGTGLGAIRRVASYFDIYSQPKTGTVVLARLRDSGAQSSTTYGVVQAPVRGESVCGDAWSVHRKDGVTTVLVADGLGHGRLAADAAVEAVRVINAQPDLAPEKTVERIHIALRATRGAAIAVAQIDEHRSEVRYAGLGNIAGTIISGATIQRMVSHNGTAGHQVRRIQEFRYSWSPGALLIMHSDGITAHWMLDKYPGLLQRDPSIIAATLFRDFSRERDDATVVAVKGATG